MFFFTWSPLISNYIITHNIIILFIFRQLLHRNHLKPPRSNNANPSSLPSSIHHRCGRLYVYKHTTRPARAHASGKYESRAATARRWPSLRTRARQFAFTVTRARVRTVERAAGLARSAQAISIISWPGSVFAVGLYAGKSGEISSGEREFGGDIIIGRVVG